MPLYDDAFSGHLTSDDPRTLLQAAGGCVWPTIPPFRYALCTGNSTGMLTPLMFTKVIFEQTTAAPGHDFMRWLMISGPLPVVAGWVDKTYVRSRDEVDWVVSLSVSSPCGILVWEFTRPPEQCNRDFNIGNKDCPGVPSSGSTGSTTKLIQLEWDKTTRSPDPCPPPA